MFENQYSILMLSPTSLYVLKLYELSLSSFWHTAYNGRVAVRPAPTHTLSEGQII